MRFGNGLACLEVELHILCVDVLVEVSVSRHFTILIDDFTLLTETLSRWLNQPLLGTVWLDRATKGLWMRVSILWCILPLGFTLICLLGRSCFLLLIQVLVNLGFKSEGLSSGLFSFSLILGLVVAVVSIVLWFTRHQRNILLAGSIVGIFEVVFSRLR